MSLGIQALNDADLKSLGRLHTAEEALALLMSGQAFDLVLVDQGLPGMNGVALGRRIAALPGCGRLPLVLLRTVVQRAGALPAPFTEALTKPVREDHLLAKLIKLMLDDADVPETEQELHVGREMGEANPLEIIVAEDNTVNRKVALDMLERLGYIEAAGH